MPLHLLIPSLLRVKVASSSQLDPTTPHPLHALLDQLLLSVRSSSSKYHVELPQILSNGGGAGEVEETMMWFALSYGKPDAVDATHHEKPWMDEAWRKTWLERMERREYVSTFVLWLANSIADHTQDSSPDPIALPQMLAPRALPII
jgi:hypothetical protein